MMIKLTFCPDCGSGIHKEAAAKEFENTVVLLSGTLDGEIDCPEAELWVQHRPKWLHELAGAAQKQEFQ